MLLVTFATGYLAFSLYASIPKGFFPDEDTGFIRGITEAQPDTSFEEMTQRQVAVAGIVSKDPGVEYVTSAVGFGGQTNRGFLFVKLKEKNRAAAGRRDHGPAPQGDRLRSRHAHHSDAGPESRLHRRPDRAGQISVHAAIGRHRLALRESSRNGAADRAAAGPARRQQRPADLQSADPRRHRPREGGGVRDHGRPGAHRALQRLWHAPDFDDLHRGRRLRGYPVGERRLPERSGGARPHSRLDAGRTARADRRGGDDAPHRRPAADQPSVAAAGGHDLVQSRARACR